MSSSVQNEQRTTRRWLGNKAVLGRMSGQKRLQHALTDVFENGSIGIHLVGPDGIIQYANRHELEMLGYAGHEYVGHHISEFHVSQEEIASILLRLADGEVLNNHEAQMRRKDGCIRDVLISSSALREDGRFVHTRCFTSDITERKQGEKRLRESEARMTSQLAATKRLQQVSTLLIQESDAATIYESMLNAAVAIMRSDFASLQMYDEDRGELNLLAFRGFSQAAAAFWEWVRPNSASTCGIALQTGKRCIVDDVETSNVVGKSPDRKTYLETGIRAVQSTPLMTRSGRFLGMISTHWRAPHAPSEDDLDLFDVLARQAADFIERSQHEAVLRNRDRRLSAVFSQTTSGFVEADNTGHLIAVNDRFCALTGRSREELLRLRMQDITHPEDLTASLTPFEQAVSEGQPFQIEKRYLRPDGSSIWVRASVVPIRNSVGEVESVLAVCADISERRHAQEQQKLLVAESAHRLKNTLSTVQAIAAQTLRSASNEERTAFVARLHALGAAHDLLTNGNWHRAKIVDVVERALTPFQDAHGQRIIMSGPEASVDAQQSLLLTLALHELATNAIKYGALANGTGQVHVTWELPSKSAASRLRLQWLETGGPAVMPPQRTGFGSRLIEQVLGGVVGRSQLHYAPSGVQCSIELPLHDSAIGERP